jgi:hypothetical protein
MALNRLSSPTRRTPRCGKIFFFSFPKFFHFSKKTYLTTRVLQNSEFVRGTKPEKTKQKKKKNNPEQKKKKKKYC